MDLFKWVGRKKREEEWMAQPRRLPNFAKALPEDSERWLVSQEFVNDEDKNLRVYMGVFQPNPKVEKWRIYCVDYNLKQDDSYMNAGWSEETTDPMEVVKALRAYERKYKNNKDYIAHSDHRPTYRDFANKHGIHFDDDGSVFRVATEAPLAKGTFMNRESLDKLFHKEASKWLPLDSWEGIYKGIVDFRSPDWTMTEKGFGLPEEFQSVNATEAGTQYDASPVSISPMASSVWEVAAQEGGLVRWNGGVGSLPTASEVAAAQKKLEDGSAFHPAIEPAPAAAPETAAAPLDKPVDVAAVAETPVPAAVASAESAPAEKPLPPVPPLVNGKFAYIHAQEMTWGDYQEMKQVAWQRAATFEDVTHGKGYPEYASDMKQLIAKLNKLPATLTSKTADRYAKENALRDVIRYAHKPLFRSARRNIAQHDCDATILVGMLRAGAALYADQFGAGKKFSPEGIQMISTVGKICVQFAIDRLGVPAEEAAKIADVITKGQDPFGAELPLEKTLAKFPAPDFNPAPPPQTYIASGKKSPPKKQPPKPRASSNDWY